VAITIDQGTKRITIPQGDLTFVSGSLYELNTETFRTTMNDLMDDEAHIWMDDYAARNAPVTVAGTTFAQTIEIINGWSLQFENLAMTVRLVSSNNNFFDVESGILISSPLVNVIGQNSAGLVVSGSGMSAVESQRLAEVWRDQGLDAANAKTITENAAGTSYDETVNGVVKEVRKAGADTVVTRQ
jgi:hypothetical protein